MQTDSIQDPVYRPAPGLPEGYCVGDDGSFWSSRLQNGGAGTEWRRVIGYVGTSGYYVVTFRVDGKQFKRYIHRLVTEAFHGPCPPKMEACHDDGNKLNNRAGNLCWGTRKKNMADKVRHGTHNRGERHNMVKITAAVAIEIRADYATGKFTMDEIAAAKGIARSTVWGIVHRRRWQHV